MNYKRFGIEDITSYDHYIGFDLGHGENSASYFKKGSDTSKDLRFDNNVKDKIFTAIYIDSEGNCKIGDNAINSNPDNGNLYIGFKTTPQRLLNGEKYKNEQITKRELIQRFFGEAIKCLFEHNAELQNGHSVIFVGCPAGKDWLENNNDVQYATLLKEGLIKVDINNIPVVVIPESHAAIAQLQHEREKKLDLTNGIMVFDLGSSTMDWCFLKSNADQAPEYESEALGGGLIEEMMLENFYDNEDTPDKLSYPDYAKANLREVKERFYTAPEGRYNTVVEFGSDDVRKRITEEFMTMITHKQEVKIYSGFDYIQGTWASLCEGFMIRMATTYETRNGHPFRGVVLLTGGVSRISFVQEICRRVFSLATVESDRQPSYSVSRGLSLFARNEVLLKTKEKSISTPPIAPQKETSSTTSNATQEESNYDTSCDESWVDIKIRFENSYDPW